MTVIQSKATHTIFFQRWEESERGWGTRPDGATMHTTKEKAEQHAKEFWIRQKTLLGEETPESYTRTSGEVEAIPVTKETYDAVVAAEAKGGVGHTPGNSWTRPV